MARMLTAMRTVRRLMLAIASLVLGLTVHYMLRPSIAIYRLIASYLFSTHGVFAPTAIEQNPIEQMLAAINGAIIEVRKNSRRYDADCTDFVPRFLGTSDNVNHYIGVFAASGLSSIKVRANNENHIYFEIPYKRLKRGRRYNVSWKDYLVISFITDSLDDHSRIISYRATLLNGYEFI
jgi:hypothetical protein